MANWDSLRHNIIDSAVYAIKHDSVFIKSITNHVELSQNKNIPIYVILISVASSILIAVLGIIFTQINKKKEFKIQQQNIDKAIADHNDQLKIDLEKIQDLKNNYYLNLKKFDFTQFEKILDIANNFLSDSDKKKSDYLKILNSITKELCNQFPLYSDEFANDDPLYWFAWNTSHHLQSINEKIDKLTSDFPEIFPDINDKLNSVGNKLKEIHNKIHNGGTDMDLYEKAVGSEASNLFEIYKEIDSYFKVAREEFNFYYEIRKKHILESKFKQNQ